MTVTYGFDRLLCESQAPLYLYRNTIDSVFRAQQRVTENKILTDSVKSSLWQKKTESEQTGFRLDTYYKILAMVQLLLKP